MTTTCLHRRCGSFGVGLLALIVFAQAPLAAEETCGAAGQPCEVENGVYHVALPEDPKGAPLVVWLHGYRGSGANAIKNEGLVAQATGRGFALIAASGQDDIVQSGNRDWNVDDGNDLPRDDTAYLKAVIADAVARFGLDGERVFAAGFSRGGSMVWDLACVAPDSAIAFAAVAGAFWGPLPSTCAAPVHLQHTHGFKDPLVPFEGRDVIWNGYAFNQSNVMQSLDVWRQTNGCEGAAETNTTEGATWIKTFGPCEAGSLTLFLHDGGHGFPKGWFARTLDWFETLQKS